MSLKRAAEQQLRRKISPEQKKQKVDDQNQEEADDFIELQYFKFANSKQICEEGMNQGFLITCRYNKEKSCSREFLKRIQSYNFQFKSRIVKLACNGVVLLLFENLDYKSLIEVYEEKIVWGDAFHFVQRVTPVFKLVLLDKNIVSENVQSATQEFVKLVNQFQVENPVEKKVSEQEWQVHQQNTMNQNQQNKHRDQKLKQEDTDEQKVCLNKVREGKTTMSQMIQNVDIDQKLKQEDVSDDKICPHKSHEENTTMDYLIQQQQQIVKKEEQETCQKMSKHVTNTTDQIQQQEQCNDNSTQEQIKQEPNQELKEQKMYDFCTYAVGVRSRKTKANAECAISRTELVDLGSQGFIKGCSEKISNVKVDLKNPQFVLMLECIPLAGEQILGIGLLKGEWCTAKPKLQPKILNTE
eukprot:TRINITY_DN26013_c2_g1_i1.p1 TRINITY_DN26013_c2_g1~~TRINITY_DN26013_c2_g1_i1.p1  ORF type:complete len:412 (-),score=58.87 TRINITY_DN26013_c2_g1_i1:23-1258(-)